jgi:hypothetical protein
VFIQQKKVSPAADQRPYSEQSRLSSGKVQQKEDRQLKVSVISGVFIKAYDSYFSVLRFDDDGVVLSVTLGNIKDIAEAWKTIRNWFRRGYENSGNYILSGNKLRFATTASYGTVEYSGEYLGDNLILNIYSHINGHRSTNVKYIRLRNIDA